MPCRRSHVRGIAVAPIERINHYIRDLHWESHVGCYKERRRHNPSRPLPTRSGLHEIVLQTLHKTPVLRLLHFIHHQQAHLSFLLQKIEEPLQQKNVILPQNVRRRRRARCRLGRPAWHGGGENQSHVPLQQNKDSIRHPQRCLTVGRELLARGWTFLQARLQQRPAKMLALYVLNLRHLRGVLEAILRQQLHPFHLRLVIRQSRTEARQFETEHILNERPEMRI